MSDSENMWKLSFVMIYAQTQNEDGCGALGIQRPLPVQFLRDKTC